MTSAAACSLLYEKNKEAGERRGICVCFSVACVLVVTLIGRFNLQVTESRPSVTLLFCYSLSIFHTLCPITDQRHWCGWFSCTKPCTAISDPVIFSKLDSSHLIFFLHSPLPLPIGSGLPLRVFHLPCHLIIQRTCGYG